MKLKNLKLATGTLLSVGLFAVAGTPAVAQSLTESSKTPITVAQAQMNIPMFGTIESITGDVATIRLQNGRTETVGLTRAESVFYRPGESVFISDGELVELNTAGRVAQPGFGPTVFENIGRDDLSSLGISNAVLPYVGTVEMNLGNAVRVNLPEGRMVNIPVTRGEAALLTPGTRVFVSNNRIVEVDERGNIVEPAYNPQELLTWWEATPEAAAQASNMDMMRQQMMRQTTTTQQRTMQQQQMQQQQQNRPVRGMW